MSRVVHKHNLGEGPREYPGHKVTLVGYQRDQATVWVERHQDDDGTIWLQVVGTGDDVPIDGQHVGSFKTDDASLVWHVYQVGPR